MKKSQLLKNGFINSSGALAYILLVSFFLNNASSIFGSKDNKFITPIVVLLLFVFSALLTGYLIIGRPLMLYIDGAKKEAVKLLFYTGAGLLFWLLIFGIILFFLK